jgi:hypothetical protein
MNVQIYFNEEVKDIVFNTEEQNEWQQLAKELGLENQQKLSHQEQSVVPYKWMNTNLINVCTTLCPAKVDVENYDKEPIPLEVMRQLAFAKKENHFDKIQIWYDDKSPDPMLIGTKCQWFNNTKNERGLNYYFDSKEECLAQPENEGNAYATNEKNYLIARWGDENKSFKQLTDMAVERLTIEVNAKLKSDIEKLKAKLSTSKENIQLFLAGELTKSQIDSTSNW